MKKLFLIVLISNVIHYTYSQSGDYLKKIIKEDIQYYCMFDNTEFKQLRYKRNRNKYLFVNNVCIDSSGLKFQNYPQLINNEKYLYEGNQIYKLDNYSVKKFKTLDYNIYCFSDFITTGRNNNIYKVNLVNGDTSLLVDMSAYLKSGEYESEIIVDTKVLNSNEIFIRTGYCVAACERFNIYLYNVSQKQLQKLIINKNETNYIFEFNIELIGESNYLGYIIYSDTESKNGEWLLDSDLNLVSKTLSKHQIDRDSYNSNQNEFYEFPDIVGYNYQNGKIENYFLKVTLDNEQSVIVPYKFDPNLEIVMYKIYNETILQPEELNVFSKYELSILRNLIFAKYNYEFSSKFYQAYFNLFAFYNSPEKRYIRTKEVNNLLTEIDKANLENIKQFENK